MHIAEALSARGALVGLISLAVAELDVRLLPIGVIASPAVRL